MSAYKAVLSNSLERAIDTICDDMQRAHEAYRAISVDEMTLEEMSYVDAHFRDIAGKINFYATDAQAIAAKIIDKREEV